MYNSITDDRAEIKIESPIRRFFRSLSLERSKKTNSSNSSMKNKLEKCEQNGSAPGSRLCCLTQDPHPVKLISENLDLDEAFMRR